jgi:hypothetical protein
MGIGYEIVTDRSITTQRANQMPTFFEIHGMTFMDTMNNRPYYARLIETYIEKVRNGYPENDAQTWDVVMDSDCIKIIKPPQRIINMVKLAMENHPVVIRASSDSDIKK